MGAPAKIRILLFEYKPEATRTVSKNVRYFRRQIGGRQQALKKRSIYCRGDAANDNIATGEPTIYASILPQSLAERFYATDY